MLPLKILIIPGSLRTGSHNVRLAAVFAEAFGRADVAVDRVSLGDFPLPIYDGDLESRSGVPRHAVNLARLVGAHDGTLIVSPEYNSSPPPLLKNALDWVSRVKDGSGHRGEALTERPFALAAASEGKLGGARCLASLRLMLSGCRATVIPQQMTLSFAHEAYGDDGRLHHATDNRARDDVVRGLIDVAPQMK